LAYHERMVEYGQINKQYSYDDSCSLVSRVFNDLDPELGGIFDNFVSRGQIDVYPKKGKQNGAFCASESLTLPTYILLNHTNKFNDVSTLAHEAGHGINNELMRENLHALDFDSPLSTAEVASTFMEDFVISDVIKEADDELKLSMMVKKMDDDVATIFRQTACYLFEQELHKEFRKKGYLSKMEIGKLFQKHMSSYMGPAITLSPGSENWWVYWGHIRSFFYVYSYASGQLISKSLQRSVKQDPQFISKVKQFLSTGTSMSPKEAFAKLGIDITQADFWKTGIKEVEDLLDETEALARKLGKIN
jgi:oligoendopeptidase F